jgi:hypothetical protein
MTAEETEELWWKEYRLKIGIHNAPSDQWIERERETVYMELKWWMAWESMYSEKRLT